MEALWGAVAACVVFSPWVTRYYFVQRRLRDAREQVFELQEELARLKRRQPATALPLVAENDPGLMTEKLNHLIRELGGRAVKYKDRHTLDKATDKLLTLCRKAGDLRDYSLELQLWWRDHQTTAERQASEEATKARRARAKARTKRPPGTRRFDFGGPGKGQ